MSQWRLRLLSFSPSRRLATAARRHAFTACVRAVIDYIRFDGVVHVTRGHLTLNFVRFFDARRRLIAVTDMNRTVGETAQTGMVWDGMATMAYQQYLAGSYPYCHFCTCTRNLVNNKVDVEKLIKSGRQRTILYEFTKKVYKDTTKKDNIRWRKNWAKA